MFPLSLSRTMIVFALKATVMQETPRTPAIIQLLIKAFTSVLVTKSPTPKSFMTPKIESTCKSPKKRIYNKRTMTGVNTEKNTIILSFKYMPILRLTKQPSESHALFVFINLSIFVFLIFCPFFLSITLASDVQEDIIHITFQDFKICQILFVLINDFSRLRAV